MRLFGDSEEEEFVFDPDSPDKTIEMMAQVGYSRFLRERHAAKMEHDVENDGEIHYALGWIALTEDKKAPYRATAAEAFSLIEQLFLEEV